MQWAGKTTVITGASRGIGRAVALAATAKGARFGLIARRQTDLKTVLAGAGGRGAIALAFRPAVVIRHLLPPRFRGGSRRSFTRELADDKATR